MLGTMLPLFCQTGPCLLWAWIEMSFILLVGSNVVRIGGDRLEPNPLALNPTLHPNTTVAAARGKPAHGFLLQLFLFRAVKGFNGVVFLLRILLWVIQTLAINSIANVEIRSDFIRIDMINP